MCYIGQSLHYPIILSMCNIIQSYLLQYYSSYDVLEAGTESSAYLTVSLKQTRT